MANINTVELLENMLKAAEKTFGKKWKEAKGYAESEFKKIGTEIAYIEKEFLTGNMDESRAQLHLKMQKNAAQTVLLMVEGLNKLAVEEAVNAAMAVVKESVNTALGFALI